MKYLKRISRVYYVGMIATDSYGISIGEATYSGAAARKMVSVCNAMHLVGRCSVIVSLPFVGTHAKKSAFPGLVISEGCVPIVFLPTLRSPYLRKLFTPIMLLLFALRHILREDTVILYNHAVEYLPSLIFLRIMGVKVVQDIEDAPTEDDRGLRGLINKLSFWVTFKLTSRRKMVVAEHVARELRLEDFVAIRGVASADCQESRISSEAKWITLANGGELKVHFGGTLIAETGVDLFCSAVERLVDIQNQLACPVAFQVTGVGELDKVRALARSVQDVGKVRLEVLPELTRSDYSALIETCHASLSLKRPQSGMANTTFPSKVIEITSSSLALVSTKISDVPSIFSVDCAYFLEDYTAEGLANIIISMTKDPDRVCNVARSGYETCNRIFAPERVGSAMERLI